MADDLKTRSVEDYFQESLKDLTFDEVSLMPHCQSIGGKIAKWARYLYEETRVLDYGKQTHSCLYKSLYHKFRFGDSELSNLKVDKKELDTYIDAEPSMKECKIKLRNQEEKCKFIQSVIDALKNQSFVINNMVKFLIYKAGGDA